MATDTAEAINHMAGMMADARGDPRLMFVVRKFKKTLEGFDAVVSIDQGR